MERLALLFVLLLALAADPQPGVVVQFHFDILRLHARQIDRDFDRLVGLRQVDVRQELALSVRDRFPGRRLPSSISESPFQIERPPESGWSRV